MTVQYICVGCGIPAGDKIDESGQYQPFPDFADEILPLLERHCESVERVILIGSGAVKVDKTRLVRIVGRLTVDHNVVTLNGLDAGNRRLMELLKSYMGSENEFNLLFQSSNLDLLKEIFFLFPEPYRKRLDANNADLSDRALSVLGNIGEILSRLDENSYLITTANESCIFCIFAHEPVRKLILSWK